MDLRSTPVVVQQGSRPVDGVNPRSTPQAKTKYGPSTNGDVIWGPKVNPICGKTGFQASGWYGPEVNSTGQNEKEKTVQLGCDLILRIDLLQVGGCHLSRCVYVPSIPMCKKGFSRTNMTVQLG